MSEMFKNLDKKKNNVTIKNTMTHNIYLIRDKVGLTFDVAFNAINDASAVRYVVSRYGKAPVYKDLELWRSDYGFDVQTGKGCTIEPAVIALPPADEAPEMPVTQGSGAVEIKR